MVAPAPPAWRNSQTTSERQGGMNLSGVEIPALFSWQFAFVKRGTKEPDWRTELKFRVKQWKQKEMYIIMSDVNFAIQTLACFAVLTSGGKLLRIMLGHRDEQYASDIVVYTVTPIAVLFAAAIRYKPEAFTWVVGLAPDSSEISDMTEDEARSAEFCVFAVRCQSLYEILDLWSN